MADGVVATIRHRDTLDENGEVLLDGTWGAIEEFLTELALEFRNHLGRNLVLGVDYEFSSIQVRGTGIWVQPKRYVA